MFGLIWSKLLNYLSVKKVIFSKKIVSALKTKFKISVSGELLKLHSELGAQYIYRDSENFINRFSSKKRRINNHGKIHTTSEEVGESLSKLQQVEEDILVSDLGLDPILQIRAAIASNDWDQNWRTVIAYI